MNIIMAYFNYHSTIKKLIAQGKLKDKLPELRKALKGSVGFHQMQMLKLQLQHIDFLSKSIEEMDEDIKKKQSLTTNV